MSSASDTLLVDIVAAHLPASIELDLPAQSRATLEILLGFALGAECPQQLSDARSDWARSQPAVLRALQDELRPTAPALHLASQKRARDSHDSDDPAPKRQRTIDADDLPRFTLPSISTISPVRKKVDLTVHTRTICFVNPSTRALEASIPLAAITRAFLLPTRGKPKRHWTVVLLPADASDKAKASPQQVIFGLDALTTASFDTISYATGTSTPTPTTVPKGAETASALRAFLSHIPVPVLEPSSTVFRSACASPRAGQGAAGIDAYLAAKSGTLWFFDEGILWGESKPCAFWAVADLLPKDGVRLISATGRTCSVILTRKRRVQGSADGDGEEDGDVGDETTFSMVDGREQDPINAWARNRKHLFGKSHAGGASVVASSSATDGNGETRSAQRVNGTVKGAAWDDSDSDDVDFEAAFSEDLEYNSTDSDEESDGEGRAGSGDEDDSQNSEESEELDKMHCVSPRSGAVSRATVNTTDMVGAGRGDENDSLASEESEGSHILLRSGPVPRGPRPTVYAVNDTLTREESEVPRMVLRSDPVPRTSRATVGAGSGDENDTLASEKSEEPEELYRAHRMSLRSGAVPRMSGATVNAAVDVVHCGLVEDTSDEEDELEE